MRVFTLILVFSLSLFSSWSVAQTAIVSKMIPVDLSVKQWTPLAIGSEVVANYKVGTCNEASKGLKRDFVYLQFINPLPKAIVVEWNLTMCFNNNASCRNPKGDDPEMNYQIEIPAGQTLETVCGAANTNSALRIFIKNNDLPNRNVLSSFELKKLKVTVK